MGEHAPADVVSMNVKDNEKISIENIDLTALYTQVILMILIVFL